jgi:anti-sigma regulatory factor (Ser/Thr protein kinase)
MSGDDAVEVVFLGLPIALYARSRQRNDELLREFTLIVLGQHDGVTERAVPARLLALTEEFDSRFAQESADFREQVDRAIVRGDDAVDVVTRMPRHAADTLGTLADLLDRADEFCLQGSGLLTLASPPEMVALRRWVFDQIFEQLAGRSPRPWSGARAPVSADEGEEGDEEERSAGLELPADPTSAGKARRFVRDVLAEWGAAYLEEPAVLLTSELVTNALLHARTPMRLWLRRRAGLVRIEVLDDSGVQPARRNYDEDASTGRGLALVDALAAEWGVEPANGGKAVWFTLALEGADA